MLTLKLSVVAAKIVYNPPFQLLYSALDSSWMAFRRLTLSNKVSQMIVLNAVFQFQLEYYFDSHVCIVMTV